MFLSGSFVPNLEVAAVRARVDVLIAFCYILYNNNYVVSDHNNVFCYEVASMSLSIGGTSFVLAS